jgi:hypothetical protein
MELFTATRKQKKYFFFTTRDALGNESRNDLHPTTFSNDRDENNTGNM